MTTVLTIAYPVSQVRIDSVRENESDLIARAARGDSDAYRQCVDRYSGRIYAIAYQIIGNAQDAQDIAQEVFVRLYRSLGLYRPTGRFTTWLYRLTVNLAIDFQRRNARHQNTSIDDGHAARTVPDPKPLPDTSTERSELRGAIHRLARTLTPKQRSVFVLRDLQGFSTEEIASILKCRKSTVRVHLANARAQIKNALLEHYPDLCGGYQ